MVVSVFGLCDDINSNVKSGLSIVSIVKLVIWCCVDNDLFICGKCSVFVWVLWLMMWMLIVLEVWIMFVLMLCLVNSCESLLCWLVLMMSWVVLIDFVNLMRVLGMLLLMSWWKDFFSLFINFCCWVSFFGCGECSLFLVVMCIVSNFLLLVWIVIWVLCCNRVLFFWFFVRVMIICLWVF